MQKPGNAELFARRQSDDNITGWFVRFDSDFQIGSSSVKELGLSDGDWLEIYSSDGKILWSGELNFVADPERSYSTSTYGGWGNGYIDLDFTQYVQKGVSFERWWSYFMEEKPLRVLFKRPSFELHYAITDEAFAELELYAESNYDRLDAELFCKLVSKRALSILKQDMTALGIADNFAINSFKTVQWSYSLGTRSNHNYRDVVYLGFTVYAYSEDALLQAPESIYFEAKSKDKEALCVLKRVDKPDPKNGPCRQKIAEAIAQAYSKASTPVVFKDTLRYRISPED